MICKRVLYTGRVQGVGFRYTTSTIAEQYPVAGFVRNLHNGCVELVAEGKEEEVDAFLEAVSRRMGSNIADEKTERMELEGFRGFTVRH